jgi:hypothetical protein
MWGYNDPAKVHITALPLQNLPISKHHQRCRTRSKYIYLSNLNTSPITKAQTFIIMAGKKNFGENGKKVSGNAQKAEAAAAKAAAANQVQAKAEDEDWGRGAKNSSKK